MKFIVGERYFRREITQELHGNYQKYLPFHNKSVVCGLLREDLNPGAPEEILPGNSAEIQHYALVFARQKDAIPIFVKRRDRDDRLEYVGNWKVAQPPITDHAEIKKRAARAGGRNNISMVLKLERIGLD
jgi:hypothetical protein